MANKRMISKKIVDEDEFLDLPATSRLLYYDLNIRADDEGFVGSVKKIMRTTGATKIDFEMLVRKKFIIIFDTGVIVIKHWYIHNYIRKDTFQETIFQEEKSLLTLDDDGQNKVYNLDENKISDINFFSVDDTLTQNRIDKISIDKNSIDNINSTANAEQLSLPTTTILSTNTNDVSNKSDMNFRTNKKSKVKYTDVEFKIIEKVIEYLNNQADKHFTTNSETTIKKIVARIREGRTLEDFKYVITNKTKQWLKNPEMNKYLRPKTLFGNSFEDYINEEPYTQKENNRPNYHRHIQNNCSNVNNILQELHDGTITIK